MKLASAYTNKILLSKLELSSDQDVQWNKSLLNKSIVGNEICIPQNNGYDTRGKEEKENPIFKLGSYSASKPLCRFSTK